MQVSLQNLSGEGGRSPLPTGAGPQAPVWGHAGPPPVGPHRRSLRPVRSRDTGS